MTQKFKGDATELKFENSAEPILSAIGLALDDFFENSYICEQLGALIYDDKRSPLVNAIRKEIFVTVFNTIFTSAFVRVGTFEAYLDVFRKVFGDEVEVEFTVTGPGKLEIDITADTFALYEILERRIVDGSYVNNHILTDAGDIIAAYVVKGIESEYELNKMLFEMVPGGIYTQIFLTIG